MTTQKDRQQTSFGQISKILHWDFFFQHSSLTYVTMKNNQSIDNIKIYWKHDKREIHLHI